MFIYLKSLASHWVGVVALIHISLLFTQILLLWPIETQLLGPLAAYASVFFLPHASRVLASWLLGPKALLALVPAEISVAYVVTEGFLGSVSPLMDVVSATVAASTAVVAFEFMKFMKINVYPRADQVPNWRGVVFAGILASVFNSITGALIKTSMMPTGDVFDIICRYLIGDTVGLVFGMVVLLLLFRLFTGKQQTGGVER